MVATVSPGDVHRDHPAAANRAASARTPTSAASASMPTAAASAAIPTAEAGVSIPTAAAGSSTPVEASSSALIEALLPEEKNYLNNLVDATDRPLTNIISRFFARFPSQRRMNAIALLCHMLEDDLLGPEGRFNAFAIIHESFASEQEHPYATILLQAASNDTSDKEERAFVQHLLIDSEDDSEVLELSAADYYNGSTLQSMELLPFERVKMTKDQAFSRLEHLCCILGIDYKEKVKEFGAETAKKRRVLQIVGFLEHTAVINFDKLKTAAKELFMEWKLSNTPFSKIAKFYWMTIIHDCSSSDEISGHDFLSLAALERARKEISSLRSARLSKIKIKYLAQKKKLVKLLSETHLPVAEVGFNPAEEVSDYKREKRRLKQIINEVKIVTNDRRETVLRLEIARRAAESKYPLDEVKAMCRKAQEAASAQLHGDDTIYDDSTVGDVVQFLIDKSETNASVLLQKKSKPPSELPQEREAGEACSQRQLRSSSKKGKQANLA